MAKNYFSWGDAYRSAFAGPPWYEISKCASKIAEVRCERGFTAQKIGEFCTKCFQTVSDGAYPQEELQLSINDRLKYPNAMLYREFSDAGDLLLAAIFWEDMPALIGQKKYTDVHLMRTWLQTQLPEQPIIWMDEIFADRDKRPQGNLRNFKNLISQVFELSECSIVAFRTINEGLLAKSEHSFDDRCEILPAGTVPDRRSFVTIRRNNNE